MSPCIAEVADDERGFYTRFFISGGGGFIGSSNMLNPFTAINGYIRFGVVTSQNDR